MREEELTRYILPMREGGSLPFLEKPTTVSAT